MKIPPYFNSNNNKYRILCLYIIIAVIPQNYGLFKVKHSRSKTPFTFGTPEKKLLIIFSYYIVFHVIFYVYYIIITTNLENISTEFLNYITCESNGHDPEDPCDKSRLEKLQQPVLEALTHNFLYLIPVLNLVFVFDAQKSSIAVKKVINCSISKLKN